MEPPVNKALKALLNSTLAELENKIDSDVLTYYGPIVDGNENALLDIVEDLAKDMNKKEQLAIVLTTTGGSAMAVERYVNIIRKHYQKIVFIIPDYAYSAGTIFSMSGDEIWMDYFSVLGPIDPQVKNKEGNFVPALGYLDKVNELIKKAQDNKLTNAEFLILKDFDLAELRAYEQAKELTISLLKKWLVKYKFKNWSTHESSGTPVTSKEKEKRAEEIAAALGDNKRWKSHGRPINIEELEELKLKIEDFSDNDELRNVIRNYYKLLQNYTKTYNFNLFIHTRKFV
ncbi:MAG TPA: serine dehydrogenasease [Candidatus Bacteroides intestinigallinarum]|nr:serine dehydrogenasease [Candidatus Bacteroides intestinigallinarum]